MEGLDGGGRGDAVGGDTFWAMGLSLWTPVPLLYAHRDSFKAHWFVNGGSLFNITDENHRDHASSGISQS